jgi:hypothetical protein
MIEPVRFKLASAALAHAMKNSRGDFFRIHSADANNRHPAFAGRRRNRGYGGFLVHEATNLNNSEAEDNQLTSDQRASPWHRGGTWVHKKKEPG